MTLITTARRERQARMQVVKLAVTGDSNTPLHEKEGKKEIKHKKDRKEL